MRQAELILKAKDLTKIIQLTWESGSRSIRSYAVAFIILNLVSQIALAMLGLVYSTNTADSAAILKPGEVTVADFSDLETTRVLSSKSQALGALRYTANRYAHCLLKKKLPRSIDTFLATGLLHLVGNGEEWTMFLNLAHYGTTTTP